MTNFSADPLTVTLPTEKDPRRVYDLLSNEQFDAGSIPLFAYQTVWLTGYSSKLRSG